MADIIFPGKQPSLVVGKSRLPGNVDLEIWQGDVQDFGFALTNVEGSAIDLTGLTPSAVLRESFTAPVSYPFTCVVVGNEIHAKMTSALSKTIPAGNYVWNLQLTNSSGDVRTYLAGDVTVYPEVDR